MRRKSAFYGWIIGFAMDTAIHSHDTLVVIVYSTIVILTFIAWTIDVENQLVKTSWRFK